MNLIARERLLAYIRTEAKMKMSSWCWKAEEVTAVYGGEIEKNEIRSKDRLQSNERNRSEINQRRFYSLTKAHVHQLQSVS